MMEGENARQTGGQTDRQSGRQMVKWKNGQTGEQLVR